uniref:UDP-glycosyltransferase 76F1 n=1 Tax=Rheum officinale TaxID=137220 RepID=A0A7L9A2H1_RHEOF|nr:UDP-glycosyltransferase 76F1 [Rheum officinale]
MQQKMGRRLVIFPLPYLGHQNPTFELANILHSKGFSITVIHTRFHSPDPAKYPHFNFHFIEDGLSESEVPFQDVISLTNTLNNKCVEPFKAFLSQILTDHGSDQEPVSCLITDVMWYFTQAVADALQVPRIVIRTGNLSSFTAFFARLEIGDKQPDDLILELPYLRVKDIPRVGNLGMGGQSPLQHLLSNTITQTKASKGLIFNAIEELEDRSMAITQHEFPFPVFPIGPFHKCISSPPRNLPTQDQNSISWLDSQAPNSVLYVSFGSLAAVDEAGFLEMAWGLANSNQPFLWVVRSDLVQSSNGSSQFPDGFLEKVSGRGHFVSWAPQKEVLAHPAVGGFWTHSGWNSTLESICEGVPMICSPCFGDQMVNARYVSEVWKIGLELEKGAKTEDMEKAIRTLMVEKEGEEIRARAACLKNKASICIQPGGSSYKHMEDLVSLIMSF